MAIGAAVPVAVPGVPSTSAAPSRGRGWLGSGYGKRGRLKRYADAMGWQFSAEGHLVGEMDGVAIRVYEDRDRVSVVMLRAPAVMPRIEMRPRDQHPFVDGDGMRDVPTGDLSFDRRYLLRAAEPWLARAVIDVGVRRALLAAPTQSWSTSGEHLVARSRTGGDPLDLLARATALRALIQAVPWEAYVDRMTMPTPAAVQAAMRERRLRPIETLPSMPRNA